MRTMKTLSVTLPLRCSIKQSGWRKRSWKNSYKANVAMNYTETSADARLTWIVECYWFLTGDGTDRKPRTGSARHAPDATRTHRNRRYDSTG